MGRKKSIDQGRILDAVEAVVARDGAARMTLDAVAQEAGISKGSVVYDHGSKQGLLRAMVERTVERDNQFNEQAASVYPANASPVIRGRIAAAATPFPDDFRAVALNICAALAQDKELRSAIQDNQSSVIRQISESSAHPRGAMLAYLALEGLKLLETLDYHSWPTDQRSALLHDIEWLVDAQPD